MFKKSLILLILLFSFLDISFWVYVTPKTELLYSNLIIKLEKNNDVSSLQDILVSLKSKLNSLKNHIKYKNNKQIIKVLDQFLYLNDEKITQIRKAIILNKLKEKTSWITPTLSMDEKIVVNQSNSYKQNFETEKLRRKNIIDKYDYSKFFKNINYTENNIFLENWIWKAYTITNYSFFPEWVSVTKQDLSHNWINLDSDLLFVTDKNTLWFIKNPKKVNLISDSIIKDIDNKYYFLEEILDDVKKSGSNSYDSYFTELKILTEELTENLNQESKIQNIYNYILKNTSYSKTIDFSNYKIFSWIETFRNHDWVCEWYAKLMSYMLMFAWINDVDTIRWYVIDAQDFPQVWHAWVKVWDKYFDPTFDDPIWATTDKTFSDYNYYNLPRDLFYTNRYNYDDLPEYIKDLSLEWRKDLIQKNLNSLTTKYKNSDYKLLELIKFKKKHRINFDEKITLDNFSKILPNYVVNNFTFYKWSEKNQILSLKYFNLESTNLENILDQLNYNLNWHYFFKWFNDDWTFSYRLGYDVELK